VTVSCKATVSRFFSHLWFYSAKEHTSSPDSNLQQFQIFVSSNWHRYSNSGKILRYDPPTGREANVFVQSDRLDTGGGVSPLQDQIPRGR
jgi:hypothetical protein